MELWLEFVNGQCSPSPIHHNLTNKANPQDVLRL